MLIDTPQHRVVDSTSLKVYGEGEWKVHQHGVGKRHTWRKLYRVVDANAQEIVAVELTAHCVGHLDVLPDRLKQLPGNEAIATIAGEGAYDTENGHQASSDNSETGTGMMPPRASAVEWPDNKDCSSYSRTALVRPALSREKQNGSASVVAIGAVWAKRLCFGLSNY